MSTVEEHSDLILVDPSVSETGHKVCVGYGNGDILPRWRVLDFLWVPA